MTELPILNIFGWFGFAGLMVFYWMIGSGRPAAAYWASTFGAAMFLIVGLASQFGYAAHLPSLWIMETCVIGLNVRALLKLRQFILIQHPYKRPSEVYIFYERDPETGRDKAVRYERRFFGWVIWLRNFRP